MQKEKKPMRGEGSRERETVELEKVSRVRDSRLP